MFCRDAFLLTNLFLIFLRASEFSRARVLTRQYFSAADGLRIQKRERRIRQLSEVQERLAPTQFVTVITPGPDTNRSTRARSQSRHLTLLHVKIRRRPLPEAPRVPRHATAGARTIPAVRLST